MNIRRTVLFAFLLSILTVSIYPTYSDTTDITLPATLTFNVTNSSNSTAATQNPTAISRSNTTSAGELFIQVRADAVNFTRPGGAGGSIPASNISWTTSNAVNGNSFNYPLDTTYKDVYGGFGGTASGSVDVTWTLAAPGTSVYAGNHTLVLRWRVLSI